MKKLSVSLLTAVTVALGAVSFVAPTQAVAATIITPDIEEGYYFMDFYFTSYPPQSYVDSESGFQGVLRSATLLSDGTYRGTYYGTSF